MCDCGGMVYTADLKSAAYGIEGSSPSSRTNSMLTMISSSPDRGTFQLQTLIEKVESGEETAESAQSMIEFYQSHQAQMRERETDAKWQDYNMEYDLRSTPWIVAKVRASEAYAQNLYAALCNQEFQKNEVWPLLKDQRWGCSWRYAGGIIADMRGEGDYIDWYCSGIQGEMGDDEFQDLDNESKQRYLYMKNNFVGESVVTDEIRQDLQKLGWIVIDDKHELL
jgi:hypothetical protein